ncbi:aspartate ammonia-lyase [Paenibacillus sp. HN-1]|uniref:aspartate ammonia-lyase n=1 Tax=Paenibacillus TaxID=44249 RepID=UPI001CA9B3AC|nr:MULTISPECIES: aspartate ammonia-lyase [Paenibacillus]MBY9078462.1 aspartate ammonia-lyase [Paenibacillus sp. CGMCC 1.18879]MBY9082755.1 aspartate ammonia-lyase [Paenibacillus sinensis]
MFRVEKDILGSASVPKDAYYGIHTLRARDNFPISGRPVNRRIIHALVLVKKAAAKVNGRLGYLAESVSGAIQAACDELLSGMLDDQFLTDAYQGGAGTSTNMNVNEVIASRAIEHLEGTRGDYRLIHPIDHVNLHQSTNDVYPTALRIAAIPLLRTLSGQLALLQEGLQMKEKEFADIMRLGRTQLMDALPIMAGHSFGAYAKAVARDRWRLYKAEERLREINLGGTAVGTGMNAPLPYVYGAAEELREMSGLGLSRSDFPMDVTQNMDVFVEVSGLLKASAVNLLKISGDFRLLNSGPDGGIGEYKLPSVQVGSSLMPGKVNPVIAEMAGSVSMRVIANDTAITLAAASGQLELNAFIPLIAESLLESLELMTHAVPVFLERCVAGIELDRDRCSDHLIRSGVMAAAAVPYVGYDAAAELHKEAAATGRTLAELLREREGMTEREASAVLQQHQSVKPGIPGRTESDSL